MTLKTKIFTALFSIVAAFALWLYVITVISPESEATFYNVPVILQGEGELADRGLMITSNANPTVTLRIAGNRSDLINLNSSNITAVADVTKVWEPGEPALTYYISYPGNIPDNVLSVQSKSPRWKNGLANLSMLKWTILATFQRVILLIKKM